MTPQQFKDVTQWQQETFGRATSLSKVAHLSEEVNELADAIDLNLKDKRLEFADCFLLLFGAASSDGMTYEDICAAIDEKMKINRSRKWGQPDSNGVVKHIKE